MTIRMAKRDEIRAFFSGQIEENMDALYGVALRLTRSGADAEDHVAESVNKAWTANNKLEDRSRVRPWILRILRNFSISQYRKLSVRPVESRYEDGDDDELSTLLNEQPDDFLIWWANPEREFFNDVLGETIMSEIERLPEAFRMTIILINVEGLTYDEAAEVLNIPPGTVRSRMKRGRTLLQKSLWEQAKEAGLTDDRPDGIRQ
jgi:RNA polymerase sigma-70 factor (ECF subfamily)